MEVRKVTRVLVDQPKSNDECGGGDGSDCGEFVHHVSEEKIPEYILIPLKK